MANLFDSMLICGTFLILFAFSIPGQAFLLDETTSGPILLTSQQRATDLQPLISKGWSMVTGRDAIHKDFQLKDFNEALRFIVGIGLEAEKMGHHPELYNVYNKVSITLTTHDVGGLSNLDIKLANSIESLRA